MLPLLEGNKIKKFNIITIQEPSQNPAIQTLYNSSTSRFYLVYKSGQNIYTYFYINKRINVDSQKAIYYSKYLYSLRINIKLGEGATAKTIQIYNIYNPSPPILQSLEGPSTLLDLEQALQKDEEQIIIGDFNLYYLVQNNPGRYLYYTIADKLLDYTTERGISLGTPEGTVIQRSRGLQNAINLIFFIEGAYYIISLYRVRKDLYYRLDYQLIVTKLEQSREGTPTRIRRVQKKTKDEIIKENIKRGLGILNRALGRPALIVPTDID